MTDTQSAEACNSLSAYEFLGAASFEVGGHDELAELHREFAAAPSDDDGRNRVARAWEQLLDELHVKTGTLLKADSVSLLLGAGASKDCGGLLMGSIPLDFERRLVHEGISGEARPRVSSWLRCFYLAAAQLAQEGTEVPTTRAQLIERRRMLGSGTALALNVNVEAVLTVLHRWAIVAGSSGRLRLSSTGEVDVDARDLRDSIRRSTHAFGDLCRLPTADRMDGLEDYRTLLRKLLTRPLNLKRANIFTLNYDTLVEQAADSEGVVLLDGFVGTNRRVFRPESYDYDLYFPAETTEGRVHRLDRVLHLYKLHGSINWLAEAESWEDPYGVRCGPDLPPSDKTIVIYPTPAKWGEALGMPYSELLRRFAAAIVRPQSVLFVLGYGFGDEHVAAIVRQALAIPSFTLVVVDPSPSSRLVEELRARGDRRVWVFSGATLGRFAGFIHYAMPDLRDEAIRKDVRSTYQALGLRTDNAPASPPRDGAVDG